MNNELLMDSLVDIVKNDKLRQAEEQATATEGDEIGKELTLSDIDRVLQETQRRQPIRLG